MTNSLLITNVQSPHWENGWVYCENGKIAALGEGNSPTVEAEIHIDGQGMILLPGFIDVHVHGALGYDTMDATPDALQMMANYYAQHGVTGFLATTWTDSHERISVALANVRDFQSNQTQGARVLGVHLEGPYLNPKRCGAQDTQYIRRADPAEIAEYLSYGVIKLVSLAPEFPENHASIPTWREHGVVVSAAHTDATYDQFCYAQLLGLSHSTHTYNAMSSLNHRAPGVVGGVLSEPSIIAELIADNIHVHPAAMNLLWQSKRPDHLVLITDAVSVAGLPEGEYQIGGRPVFLRSTTVQLADDTLAGSTLTMEMALRNFMQATHTTWRDVWQVTSRNAARELNLTTKGEIALNFDADLVLLDAHYNVHLTIIGGDIAYQKEL